VADTACYSCGLDRLARDVAPVVPGYEIRSFECARCGSVLRLVCRSGAGSRDQGTDAG